VSRIRRLATSIEEGLRERTDPKRREATLGYFPTRMEILGVSAPAMREVVRAHRAEWRALEAGDVIALAQELCDGGLHEGRQVGYLILEGRPDVRSLLDREVLESLGSGNDNWASVDTFGGWVAGPAWREGRITDAVVADWAAADNVWWRRTALVCAVALNIRSRGGTGDVPRTLAVCTRLAADPEDMVVKALSWALRSLVAHDPEAVRGFLAQHDDVLAARVKREVGSKLETGRKN
jgi:3-methyladenine DNA glycosylase AlkD